jgi:hypothetical protein
MNLPDKSNRTNKTTKPGENGLNTLNKFKRLVIYIYIYRCGRRKIYNFVVARVLWRVILAWICKHESVFGWFLLWWTSMKEAGTGRNLWLFLDRLEVMILMTRERPTRFPYLMHNPPRRAWRTNTEIWIKFVHSLSCAWCLCWVHAAV